MHSDSCPQVTYGVEKKHPQKCKKWQVARGGCEHVYLAARGGVFKGEAERERRTSSPSSRHQLFDAWARTSKDEKIGTFHLRAEIEMNRLRL